MEARLGSDITGRDILRAQSNLDDVSILVRSEGIALWQPFDAPDEARLVTIQAALRAYRNPDGFTGENIGGAYSYTYGPGATNGVYLNADEVRLVRLAAGLSADGRPKGFLGAIRTPSAYNPDSLPVTYVGDGILLSDPLPFPTAV
jgi:hypothetical protein